MQRQWTIEVRADFSDPGAYDVISTLVKQAAVYLNANTALVPCSITPPKTVVFSDDFFAGHEDLDLLADTLGTALVDHGGKVGGDAVVSDEMLQAVRDMQHDKNNDH